MAKRIPFHPLPSTIAFDRRVRDQIHDFLKERSVDALFRLASKKATTLERAENRRMRRLKWCALELFGKDAIIKYVRDVLIRLDLPNVSRDRLLITGQSWDWQGPGEVDCWDHIGNARGAADLDGDGDIIIQQYGSWEEYVAAVAAARASGIPFQHSDADMQIYYDW